MLGAVVLHQDRGAAAHHPIGPGGVRLTTRTLGVGHGCGEEVPSIVHAPGEHEARSKRGRCVSFGRHVPDPLGEVASVFGQRDGRIQVAGQHVRRRGGRKEAGPNAIDGLARPPALGFGPDPVELVEPDAEPGDPRLEVVAEEMSDGHMWAHDRRGA